MKTIYVKPENAARKWFVIDAKDKILGRVAEKAAVLVRGKHKPLYVPHQEIGDFVIIVNAEKAVVSGNKANDKMYYRHSGYLGSLKSETYSQLVARKPVSPLEKAIRGMLPRGALGNKLYKSVKVYAGEAHPHEAQQPEVIEI